MGKVINTQRRLPETSNDGKTTLCINISTSERNESKSNI